MTEEMSREFEMFSQMLDEEGEHEFEDAFVQDAEILLDLRQTLRQDKTEPPSDFARKTAEIVELRYEAVSPLRKLLDQSRHLLLQKAFAPSSVWKAGSLFGVGLLLGLWDPQLLLSYGVLLACLGGGWLAQDRLSGPAPQQRTPSPDWLLRGLFHFFPVLATLFTGLLTGLVIAGLSSVSLSFKETGQTSLGFGILVGVGVFFLLCRALQPMWSAYRQAGPARPFHLLMAQLMHASWFGLVFLSSSHLYLWTVNTKYDHQSSVEGFTENWKFYFGGFVLLASVLSWFLIRRSPLSSSTPDLRAVRINVFKSLALCIVPIVLALTVFYQLHLTRKIHDPSYTSVLEDAKAWEKQQMAIPAEQNGFLEIRQFFIKAEQEKDSKNFLVPKKIKKFAEYYIHAEERDDPKNSVQRALNPKDPEARRAAQKELVTAREDFLQLLPLMKKAVSKPHFSSLPTDGYSYESQIPDYIAYRAATQGLARLTNEALERDDSRQALEYIELALKWGRNEEPGTLIGMMISVAQLTITYDCLEQAVLEGKFNDAQLRQLVLALEKARYEPKAFSDTMKRETYLSDKAFQSILEGRYALEDLGTTGWLPLLVNILPNSYWESERNAYWNYQLGRSADWQSLSFQENEVSLDEELNPFNIASSTLVPNYQRARAQFCLLHSKYSSLILICQLERYKLKYGNYPVNLEAIVPEFMETLPVDLMSEEMLKRKTGFQYKKTDRGFVMTSSSRAYESLFYKETQSYGHDGQYRAERLSPGS